MLRILWADMDIGGFSAALAKPVLHFNGKLFKQPNADGYLLANAPGPMTLVQIESAFSGRGGWTKALPILLETLVALGRAQQLDTSGIVTSS